MLPPDCSPPWPGGAARDLLVRSRRLALEIHAEHNRPALFRSFDDLIGALARHLAPGGPHGSSASSTSTRGRPWDDDGEHRLLQDALEQVELADRWASTTSGRSSITSSRSTHTRRHPEVFLGAASQRTSTSGWVTASSSCRSNFNHTARVVERIATLDLVSDGRVDFGTGEASSEAELGGFLIAREQKRAQWDEALDAATACSWRRPSPVTTASSSRCRSRRGAQAAAEAAPTGVGGVQPPGDDPPGGHKGIGALSFSFIEPAEAKAWVDNYYATLASDECVPGGFAVNPNVAVVLPMMCHADEETAIGAGSTAPTSSASAWATTTCSGRIGRAEPAWNEFEDKRDLFGFRRQTAAQTGQTLGRQLFEQGLGALRGAIRDYDQVRELMRGYEDAGVDQVIFVSQAGRNRLSTSASHSSCLLRK